MAERLISFSTINPSQIVEELENILNNSRQKIAEIIQSHAEQSPTWESFVYALESVNDRIEQFWSPISHLHAVADTLELRKAYEACVPMLTAYATEMAQNKPLCELWKGLNSQSLNKTQCRVVALALREFRLSGIDLPNENREQFSEMRQRLAALSTTFSNNVLDATQAFTLHISDEAELRGVPESAKSLYQKKAKDKGLDGWMIGLDMPSYLPIMQYADERVLREKLYKAYTTRASEYGEHAPELDNTPLMRDIMSIRQQLANIVGCQNYAELSLESKMADTPKQVINFLEQLVEKSLPQAKEEFSALCEYAENQLNITDVQPWDVAYITEKLRVEHYAISQEALRPYFPIHRVLEGLFDIIQRLFSVSFAQVSGMDIWHEDVLCYEVTKNNQPIAYVYLDLYAREGKRGGAWMADARSRRRLNDGTIQLPIAFLTCNFAPPEIDKPALLTHDEVTTLFHEFGHGLHHMLTTVDIAAVAGINGVPWDAVELPSQFLENWCWEPEGIRLMSGHYATGEPLPLSMLEKMMAAKNFQSAMQMMRQLEFALFDMRIHDDYQSDDNDFIGATLQRVRQRVAVYPVPTWNRFENSFSHIFSGGYAAGYYSYKWAEVLSADAFSRFEEEGIFNAEVGQQFLDHILSQGGSEEPSELFERFRGRAPSIEPLLRHSGIQ